MVALVNNPLVFRPTADGFHVNAVVTGGLQSDVVARVRATGSSAWGSDVVATPFGTDVSRWDFSGLMPGVRYDYELRTLVGDSLYVGRARTLVGRGSPVLAVVLTDAHIDAADIGGTASINFTSAASLASSINPDFVVSLGDNVQFVSGGFNAPAPDTATARAAYLEWLHCAEDFIGNVAHFPIVGNWCGRNGWDGALTDNSTSQALLYLPGPDATTYPAGGGANQDYYAFESGDALFIVLNVQSYTMTPHTGSGSPEARADTWTLGAEQLAWLESTLATSSQRWKVIFSHHIVGGAGSSGPTAQFYQSAYGRGGGQGCYVGEQEIVHNLMQKYGVQVFLHGHDHVFTDIVRDGIHYTCVGVTGHSFYFDAHRTGYSLYYTGQILTRLEVSASTLIVSGVYVATGVVASTYTLDFGDDIDLVVSALSASGDVSTAISDGLVATGA
jgi:hypothetical protein